MKLKKLCSLYLKNLSLDSKFYVVNDIKGHIKYHILDYFKDIDVEKITLDKMLGWKTYMAKKDLKDVYKRKIFIQLSTIFNFGLKTNLISSNPCRMITNFKDNDIHEYKIWTLDEFNTFINSIDLKKDFKFYVLFNFLFFTGVRRGEMLGLQWKNVYDDHVRIEKQVYKRTVTSCKSKASVRDVFISESLHSLLMELKSKSKYVEDEAYVFGGVYPLATTTIDRRLHHYIEKSGVKRITLHEFRHSFVTNYIAITNDVVGASSLAGHKSTTITLSIYSHAQDSLKKRGIKLIEEVYKKTVQK